MSREQEIEEVKKIAEAARAFLAVYDEFMPEHPEALSEYLDALLTATGNYGD